MEIHKYEQRSVIKFLFLQKNKSRKIHEELVEVYTDSALSYPAVTFWCRRFKRGNFSLDDEASGRPETTVITPDNIDKVEDLILEDRRIKVREIADETGISIGSVEKILHDHLGVRKLVSLWVPKFLTAEQKRNRVQFCEWNLQRLYDDPDYFSRVITGNETWVHYYDPESREASKEWRWPGEKPGERAKSQISAGKVMATVFWDMDGILLVDYLPPKTTITSAQYAETLGKLRAAIRKKRRGKRNTQWVILHDNARVHGAPASVDAMIKYEFGEMSHPPYSPDLAPSDYHLFPELKKDLKGRRFTTDDELKSAVAAFFDSKQNDFFSYGIHQLEYRWEQCILLKGHNIEKKINFCSISFPSYFC
jgi:histone-lysine N-methyltransferase SETMAR